MLLVLRAVCDKIANDIRPPTKETENAVVFHRVKDAGVLDNVKAFDPMKGPQASVTKPNANIMITTRSWRIVS